MDSLSRVNLDNPNQLALTADQMSKIDRITIEEFGIDILQMMELAGFQLASLCKEYISKKSRVLILAGSGHNGGGGLVAAKHLHNWGYKTSILVQKSMGKLFDTSIPLTWLQRLLRV